MSTNWKEGVPTEPGYYQVKMVFNMNESEMDTDIAGEVTKPVVVFKDKEGFYAHDIMDPATVMEILTGNGLAFIRMDDTEWMTATHYIDLQEYVEDENNATLVDATEFEPVVTRGVSGSNSTSLSRMVLVSPAINKETGKVFLGLYNKILQKWYESDVNDSTGDAVSVEVENYYRLHDTLNLEHGQEMIENFYED